VGGSRLPETGAKCIEVWYAFRHRGAGLQKQSVPRM